MVFGNELKRSWKNGCARCGSPIVIGLGVDETVVASMRLRLCRIRGM